MIGLAGDGMDGINEILSSLSDKDMDDLMSMAQGLFGSDGSEKKNEKSGQERSTTPDISSMLQNAQMMAKLSSMMSALNKQDNRTKLIEALKPLLSEGRRKKADEAIQLVKLMDMLPLITSLFGGDGK